MPSLTLRTLILLLLSFVAHDCLAQAVDSPDDEEMNVFLSVLAIIGMGVMLGVAILTVLIAALAMVCTAALISAGILSASVAVGIYRKSFYSAVKTAVYSVTSVIAGIGGVIASSFLCKILSFNIGLKMSALTGLFAGAVGGLLGAMGIIWVIRTFYQLTVSHFSPALKQRA